MTLDRRIRTSLLSIASDAVLIAAKGVLCYVTGSMALRADALHSASDLGISFVVLLGLLFRRRKERQNTSGESLQNDSRLCRIEAAVSYIISCLILYAPYEIASTLLSRQPEKVSNLGIGVGGILGCIALTGFIARLKLQVGKETGSATLTADGYHSGTDFFSSVAVLFAIMGDSIGISLDPIVAALIALLIGVTGIELFIASARSLISGKPLKTDDLGDWLARAFRWMLHPPKEKKDGEQTSQDSGSREEKFFGGRMLFQKIVRSIQPLRLGGIAAALAVLCWGLSGITAIQPDEVGVRLRFGRVTSEPLRPGLHFALPYPFERILRQKPREIRRVEIGFRTAGDGRENRLFDESISVAGDESVADLNLTVHFTVPGTLAGLFRSRALDETVRALAESAVREVMAAERTDAVFSDGQPQFLSRVEARLREDLNRLDLGVSVTNVFLTAARPPSSVMQTFRDVFSAREDQLRELQQAEAKRNDAIPKARAESAARISEAKSFETDRRLRTQGDAQRFLLQSAAAKSSPDITAYRLFIETAEKGLAGHKKIIADPSANFGGYQLWLFGPSQPPVPSLPETRSSARKAVP